MQERMDGRTRGANLTWRGGGVPDGDCVEVEVSNGLGIEFLFQDCSRRGGAWKMGRKMEGGMGSSDMRQSNSGSLATSTSSSSLSVLSLCPTVYRLSDGFARRQAGIRASSLYSSKPFHNGDHLQINCICISIWELSAQHCFDRRIP